MNNFIRSLIFATIFLIINVFSFMNVSASVNGVYNISSGLDNSDGLNDIFLDTEIARLSISDNDRIQSNGNWPIGNYDENKYIEFVFSPNIQSDAVIESVSISHEYYKTVILAGAKLEVWDGNSFVDYPINLPTSSGTANEISQTIDIFNTVNTANQVNQLLVRFLAYRATNAVSIKTSHDLMVLNLSYSIPEIVPPPVEPDPEPIPDSDPEPEPEPEPEPVEPIDPEEDTDSEQNPEESQEQEQIENEESDLIPVETVSEQNNSVGVVPIFILNSENQTNQSDQINQIVNKEIPPNSSDTQQQPNNLEQDNLNIQTLSPEQNPATNSSPAVFENPIPAEENILPADSSLENEQNQPKIDPEMSLAAAGNLDIANTGDNWWLVLLMFAIIGAYLAIRIRQKP